MKQASVKIIDARNKIVKFSIGPVTIWTIDDTILAFQSIRYTHPVIWNGKKDGVSIDERFIDIIDGKGSCRHDKKTFDRLLNTLLNKHDLKV